MEQIELKVDIRKFAEKFFEWRENLFGDIIFL